MKRRYISQTEMTEIWDRWEKGESINAIARDLGRYHSVVQGALARTGGMRLRRDSVLVWHCRWQSAKRFLEALLLAIRSERLPHSWVEHPRR